MTDYKELEKAQTLLASIDRITCLLQEDSQFILRKVIKEVSEVLDVSKGEIFLKNKSDDLYFAAAAYDVFNKNDSFENSFDLLSISTNWLQLLKNNEIVIVDDVYRFEFDQVLTAYFYKLNLKSILLYPIFYNSKLCGYIRLDDRFESKTYSNAELLYLNSTSNVIKKFIKSKERAINPEILENEIEKIFNVINDEAVIFSKDGIIKKANSEYSKKYDKSPEEMIGEYVWTKCPDDIFKIKMNVVKKVIETGKPSIGEISIGEEWFSFRVFPIKDEGGCIVDLAAFSRNITIVMKNYNQLKYQKEKYAALFENIKCGAAVFESVNNGENFVVKDINKSGEKLDNVKKSDIIGKLVTDVFPGIKKFGLFEVFKRVYETGISEELPLNLYEDSRISGWRTNFVFKLSSGEIVSSYQDLTDLKKTESELSESKKKLELAIQGTGAGIWEWDIEKDTFKCSEKWAEIIGYKLCELEPIKKEKWYEICHPDDLPKINRLLKKHLDGKSTIYENEIRLKHKNGNWMWVLDRGSIVKFDNNGKPLFMAGTHIDISDSKSLKFERDDYILKLEKALDEIISAISTAVDIRDSYTHGHQENVAVLSKKIAEEMKLDGNILKRIIIAAKLHDIGKIFIPDSILNKPGKLNEDEFEIIKTHVSKGYEILKNITLHGNIADIVRQHHERVNGSGYPLGLKGDEILLEACIVGTADVVDAMISDRPYRKALKKEEAIEEIKNNSGTLYNSEVVDACIRVLTKMQ